MVGIHQNCSYLLENKEHPFQCFVIASRGIYALLFFISNGTTDTTKFTNFQLLIVVVSHT